MLSVSEASCRCDVRLYWLARYFAIAQHDALVASVIPFRTQGNRIRLQAKQFVILSAAKNLAYWPGNQDSSLRSE